MNELNPSRPQFITETASHRHALFFVSHGISSPLSSISLFRSFSSKLTHSRFLGKCRIGVEFHESRDLALNDQCRRLFQPLASLVLVLQTVYFLFPSVERLIRRDTRDKVASFAQTHNSCTLSPVTSIILS